MFNKVCGGAAGGGCLARAGELGGKRDSGIGGAMLPPTGTQPRSTHTW